MKVPADLSICKPMKRNKVLKSLAELSPELLGVETAGLEQTKPRQTEVTAQQGQQTPHTISFSPGYETPGVQRWGIDE